MRRTRTRWHLVRDNHGRPLMQDVTETRWFSRATADFAGLTTKGRIAAGADADLTVFAPEAAHRIEVGELRFRNPVSAYLGHDLVGVVRGTVRAGAPVDADAAPRGRLLRRA